MMESKYALEESNLASICLCFVFFVLFYCGTDLQEGQSEVKTKVNKD